MRAPPARPNLRARITHSYRPREKGSSEASRRRPVAHARVRSLHPSIAGNVKAELDLFISKGGLRLIKTDGKILGAFPLQRIQQWGITQPDTFKLSVQNGEKVVSLVIHSDPSEVSAIIDCLERKVAQIIEDVRAEAAQAPQAGQTWLGLLHLARTKPAVPPRRPFFNAQSRRWRGSGHSVVHAGAAHADEG